MRWTIHHEIRQLIICLICWLKVRTSTSICYMFRAWDELSILKLFHWYTGSRELLFQSFTCFKGFEMKYSLDILAVGCFHFKWLICYMFRVWAGIHTMKSIHWYTGPRIFSVVYILRASVELSTMTYSHCYTGSRYYVPLLQIVTCSGF